MSITKIFKNYFILSQINKINILNKASQLTAKRTRSTERSRPTEGSSGDRGVGDDGSVGNNRSVVGGAVVSRSRTVGGHALVGHVGDVAAVGIGHVVVDVLHPAVGQSHSVGAAGGVAVPLLLLTEVGAAVVVGNAVLVGVDGGLLMVAATVAGSAASRKSLAKGGADNHGEDEESLESSTIKTNHY